MNMTPKQLATMLFCRSMIVLFFMGCIYAVSSVLAWCADMNTVDAYVSVFSFYFIWETVTHNAYNNQLRHKP